MIDCGISSKNTSEFLFANNRKTYVMYNENIVDQEESKIVSFIDILIETFKRSCINFFQVYFLLLKGHV